MKKYNVVEIDRMRKAVRDTRPLRSYNEAEELILCEEMLRTYMMAGVSVDDLEKRAREYEIEAFNGAVRQRKRFREFDRNPTVTGY